ncbi:MAG: hypothetical protein DRM98_04325 [Thermoplasmata archaeon]|nr:MAG: hypothetical protein DRM98_04325 [Thermoplasmata archaeon]
MIVKKNKRNRYIVFDIHSKDNKIFDIAELNNAIQKQCKKMYNKNCREMGIKIVKLNGQKGIVRCDHIEKENTINLLNSIREVSSTKVEIKTLKTSGTIKTFKRKKLFN